MWFASTKSNFPSRHVIGVCVAWAVACGTSPAQSPADDGPVERWIGLADEMFDHVMEPTEAQQERLEQVEISVAEEQRVGRSMMDEFLQQSHLHVRTYGRDAHYLQTLVEQVKPLMENSQRYRSITVFVATSKTTDARSFPGGRVVFTTGMLDYAQSEAEVAGILAHELSHIDRGHQLERLRTTKLAEETFTSGGTTWQEMAFSGQTIAKLFARPYRPEQEAEADLDAARWLFELGYDPNEMANLFARFGQRDRRKVFPTPQFVRSHPYYSDRQQAVSRLYDELHEKHPERELYVGRQNLRERVPRSEKEFGEELRK